MFRPACAYSGDIARPISPFLDFTPSYPAISWFLLIQRVAQHSYVRALICSCYPSVADLISVSVCPICPGCQEHPSWDRDKAKRGYMLSSISTSRALMTNSLVSAKCLPGIRVGIACAVTHTAMSSLLTHNAMFFSSAGKLSLSRPLNERKA